MILKFIKIFFSMILKKIYVVISGLFVLIILLFWPQNELDAGSNRMRSFNKKILSHFTNDMRNIRRIRSFGNETILYDVFNSFEKRIDSTVLSHNGYVSLSFYDDNKTVRRESLFGTLPSLFSKENKRALVLGLGSGITASAVSDFYEFVKIFEVNPTMKKVSHRLRKQNRNLLWKDNIEIVIQDAFIGTYLEEDGSYDLINHTISNLSYYTASKIFSKEFFEIVKNKLKKDGVFSLWYDSRFSFANIDIVYNTLLSVFDGCKTFLLNAYYHVVVCGESLELRPYKDFNLEDEFIQTVASYTPYLEVNAQKYFGQGKYETKINILNKLLTYHNYSYQIYHQFDESQSHPVEFDPFIQLVLESINNSKNDNKKICEALNFFGYQWGFCVEN